MAQSQLLSLRSTCTRLMVGATVFVQGRVQYVRPDGRVNITLRGSRTERQDDDSEVIYTYLVNRGGGIWFIWIPSPPLDVTDYARGRFF